VGQQQLLLIILGVIIVGVAIAVGIMMFVGQNASSTRDAIETDLMNIGSDAYEYKIRPVIMGGGGGTYKGYVIASTGAWGDSNPNAFYTITQQTDHTLALNAAAKAVEYGTIQITFGVDGTVTSGPTSTF
jgi:hypothetical protein